MLPFLTWFLRLHPLHLGDSLRVAGVGLGKDGMHHVRSTPRVESTHVFSLINFLKVRTVLSSHWFQIDSTCTTLRLGEGQGTGAERGAAGVPANHAERRARGGGGASSTDPGLIEMKAHWFRKVQPNELNEDRTPFNLNPDSF